MNADPRDYLYAPGRGVEPDVHTVDNALNQARRVLAQSAHVNVHAVGQVLVAATSLDFVLRQLVKAIDAERGAQ